MLVHQTIDKLEALGLKAMAAGLTDQLGAAGQYDELGFCDRLGLLVDKEADARDSRRLASRLKAARLRHQAVIEDVDFRSPRGIDRSHLLGLAEGRWVDSHHNVLVTGATGCGKSFISCALAHSALRRGHSALYVRTPRLIDELALGRADGRYVRTLGQLARVSLLVLDDFLLTPVSVEASGTCSRWWRTAPGCARPSSRASCRSRSGRGDGRSHAGRGRPRPPAAGGAPHRLERAIAAQAPAAERDRGGWSGAMFAGETVTTARRRGLLMSTVVIWLTVVLAVSPELIDRELTTLRPTEADAPAHPTFSAPESTRCRGPPRRRRASIGRRRHTHTFRPVRTDPLSEGPIHR